MLRSTFSSLREYLTPVNHVSNFQKTGELTPEEFVRAGDYLVYKFPTWEWGSASPSKRRDFLPANKQFLVTKHVPSHQRAADVANSSEAAPETTEDGWVVSGAAPIEAAVADLSLGDDDEPAEADLADLADLEDDTVEAAEAGADANAGASSGHGADTRTYNVYITYSTSYRVPKLYLSGFDAEGVPLPPKAMFSDIMADYKDKTVTIEPAPFLENLTLISIHPCRHAGVMRLLLDRAASAAGPSEASAMSSSEAADAGGEAAEGEDWEEVDTGLRVDQYLVIFLKFIAGVTPTIEYDFTMSAL